MAVCVQCNSEIPEGSKFCLECGSRISSDSSLEREISLGGGATFEKPSLPESNDSLDRMVSHVGRQGKLAGASGAVPFVPVEQRYELHEELGRGGFGVVYRATDRNLTRTVAIKRLLTADGDHFDLQTSLERFTREARVIAGLNHRNVIRVFDHNRDDKGMYLVME